MGGLRGFVAQDMSGRRASPPLRVYNLTKSQTSLTLRDGGRYRISMWGAGGAGGDLGAGARGGASGAFISFERSFAGGATIVAMTGSKGKVGGLDGGATTVTLPSGQTFTAGGGQGAGGAAGVATPTGNSADILLNGSLGGQVGGANGVAGLGDNGGPGGTAAGGSTAGGGGAPAQFPKRGGAGGNSVSLDGDFPGAGGAYNAGATGNGADGLILVEYLG